MRYDDTPPLSSLRYFLAIVDAGSFTKAAHVLRVAQPSLSVAMRKLESELGAPLLHRARNGVTTTAAGKLLADRARAILLQVADTKDEIRSVQGEPSGRFTIGCHESLAAYALPRFMGRFLREHPRIELALWNGNSREVERAVAEREVDLGLVVNPGEQGDAVVKELFRDRVEFIGTVAVRKRAMEGALLGEVPLLYVPELRQVQSLLSALESQRIRPRALIPCSSLALVKSLVVDGVGIGILPHRVAMHGMSKGKLVPMTKALPYFEDRIALVRRYDMPMTRGATLTWEALLAHGRAFPALPPRS